MTSIDLAVHDVARAEIVVASRGVHRWKTIFLYDKDKNLLATVTLFAADGAELPIYPQESSS